MKRLMILCAAALLVAGTAGTSLSTTITFDERTPGTYASLNYGDVIFTNTMGNLLVEPAGPLLQDPLSGNIVRGPSSHDPAEWNIATFSTVVNQVSVDIGDYNADWDTLQMYAYDSGNNELASVTLMNPWDSYSALTLTVSSASSIAYVKFGEQGQGNFETGYPGSAYFDNFTYNAVPEPATLLLFGTGLLGLCATRRKFRS